MKRLSLSVLLLLLGASNAQAFSLTQWTQKQARQAYGWVKKNPKKIAIGSAATLAAAICLGYKAHTTYPRLSVLAGMKKALLDKDFYKSFFGRTVQMTAQAAPVGAVAVTAAAISE